MQATPTDQYGPEDTFRLKVCDGVRKRPVPEHSVGFYRISSTRQGIPG